MHLIAVASFALASASLVLADRPGYPQQPPPYGQPPPAPYGYCDPKQPPKCAVVEYGGQPLPYCLEDPEYPVKEVAAKISEDPIFLKKYSDVPDQSADDLVEHLTRYQEDAYNYNYYTGASTGPSPFDLTHWSGPEGYLCPSQVNYGRIHRAVNVEGDWRIIVQHISHSYSYGQYNYTQTSRLETCLTPNSACRLIAPACNSRCAQKSAYIRLLSLNPCDLYAGFFIDVFKLPSACSCHISSH